MNQRSTPEPKKRRKRLRGLVKRLVLLSIGLLFGLAVAEISLIVMQVSFLLPYEPNQHCGVRLRPGLEGWYIKEGRASFQINQHGQRDIDRQLSKPANTIRVAVIGDSYAEAMQVERDQAFWAVLERELNRQNLFGDQQVEVLNFGVSGYGTAQELQMLRHYVWAFEPDIVMLAFLSGNDLMDNSREIGPAQPRPYFDLIEGELILDDRYLESTEYQHATKRSTQLKVSLINRFRLLQVVNEVKSIFERRNIPQEDRLTLDELGLDWRVYMPPESAVYEQAWDITQSILQQMANECEAEGAEFVVVSLSNAIQVDPDESKRQAFCEAHEIEDLSYPDLRIKQICAESEIECLTLAPRLAAKALSDNIYYHGFENTQVGTGHWNQNGHAEAGKILVEAFSEEGAFSKVTNSIRGLQTDNDRVHPAER